MSKRRTSPSLSKFDCADYSHSDLATAGCYDEQNQYRLVVPVSEAEELLNADGRSLDFLQIGGPGVDGIAFGYRTGKFGVWAYYPSEGRFELVAKSAQELERFQTALSHAAPFRRTIYSYGNQRIGRSGVKAL